MRRVVIAAFTVFLLFALAVPVGAGYFTFEPDETERNAEDYYGEFRDALPEEMRDELMPGEGVDVTAPWQTVLSEALSTLWDEIFPAAGRLGVLLSICVLCAVLCAAVEAVDGRGIVPLIARTVILLFVAAWQIDSVAVLSRAMERLGTVTSGLATSLIALSAATGTVTSASVGGAGFAVLSAMAGDVFTLICVPMLRVALATGLAASAASSKIVAAVSTVVRNTLAMICTVGMTVFVFVFNVQMNLASSADSALLRTVKLALSSSVPVVGGPVSDAGGQLGASLTLIRTSCGAIAVCAVLILTLPVIVRLSLDRFALFVGGRVLSALAPQLGDDVLSGSCGTATVSLAAAVSAAAGFVLCLAAFVRAAGGG